MHAAVPLRTFFSTIKIVIAANFNIFTGVAAVFPACGTQGIAMHPDCRPDEAGYKKRAGGCREYSHLIAVNLQLGLASKGQYGHEEDLPEQIVQGFAVGERSIDSPRIVL